MKDDARDPREPQRRRIFLMRHGAVDYFRADGAAIPPKSVPLNPTGREQADAAGKLFAACGVRFDRVVTSGLPRTVETAQRVLAAAGQSSLPIAIEPAFEEMRGGRLADLPPDRVEQAFLGAFRAVGRDVESHRILDGESIGELLDRVLPAFDAELARADWRSLLLVLHGGVNRALIARSLVGERAFFGRLEQTPACINIIDAGIGHEVVRAINIAPTQWLHEREHLTTMEKLLAQFLRQR